MRSRFLVLTSIAVFMIFDANSHAVDDNASRPAVETKAAESGLAMTAGVVKKVDKAAGKVTISHGPLVNLGMPKMTMVFHVNDPAMLDQLKEGDMINFVAEKVNGSFTVMRFEHTE